MSHRAQAAVVPTAALVGVAAAAVRYAAARAAADRHWLHWAGQRLTGIGEVDAVTVLPLVERVTSRPGLRGEPGLSYLITAGPTRLLFDTGLNLRGKAESALVHNAAALGADLAALDAVVISICTWTMWAAPGGSCGAPSRSPASRWSPQGSPPTSPPT